MENRFIKLSLILTFSLLFLSAKCSIGQKYASPPFEDCTILTQWDAQKETDTATVFCLDSRLNKEYFTSILIPAVELKFKEHPLHDSVMKYLNDNKESIIKDKEYELPISYGRGDSATNQTDRTALLKWAEDNRMGRLKCESSNPNQ